MEKLVPRREQDGKMTKNRRDERENHSDSTKSSKIKINVKIITKAEKGGKRTVSVEEKKGKWENISDRKSENEKILLIF